jgi:phospholipid transport system transporter-binding protein
MKLPATLTLKEAAATARAIEAEIGQTPAGGVLRVDASALQSFDTGAIAVLLQGLRTARAKSVRLELRAPPEKFSRLASLYGVSELLSTEPLPAADATGHSLQPASH